MVGEMLHYRYTNGLAARDPHYYIKAHNWIKKHKKREEFCEICGRKNRIRKLDYANISQQYKLYVNDWLCLCKICHIEMDVKNAATKDRMKYFDMYVWEFIQKYKEKLPSNLVYKRIGNNKKRDVRILIDWATLEYTYLELGKKYGKEKPLSIERIRQVISKLSYVVSNIRKI